MAPRLASVVGQPEAHRHFLLGIDALADLLSPGLGPLGGRVAGSDSTTKRIEVWDDAATIVRRVISLGDPQADIGAMLLRNMVWRMEQRVGDGGAGAAILARALARGGMRLLAAGVHATELAKGLRLGGEAVAAALRAQARPVEDEDTLSHLALTVTRDPALSTLLGEMRYLLGAEGHVQVEKHVAQWLDRRYLAGAHFEAEIASFYFYNDLAQRAAVLAAPAVALIDEPLTTAEAALALLEAAVQAEASSLLIVASAIGGQALSLLATNQQKPAGTRPLTILAVRLLALVEERGDQMAALAARTHATLLGDGRGRAVIGARPGDLGTAQRVHFSNKALTVLTEDAVRATLRKEVTAVQARLAALAFDHPERPALSRRLAALSGGVGVLMVGAASEAERAVRHESATHGLRVLSCAQRSGVVPGGGAAFIHAARALAGLQVEGDVALGVQLLGDALPAVLCQIAQNAGEDHPGAVARRVAEAGPPCTWDALSRQLVDAHSSGVLDACDVAEATLRNAISCALMALTTNAIVYHAAPAASLAP